MVNGKVISIIVDDNPTLRASQGILSLQLEGNGQIWFADLFRVLPDGVGPDGNPGYPLVTFYLNAKDLASGFEFDAAQDAVPPELFLQVSGLSVTYDMSKGIFARVTGIALETASGSQPLHPSRRSLARRRRW